MTDTYRCGDDEALVAYLYDECDPADRERIAAHLALCAACADEAAALRSTRGVLASWTPPEAELGFRISAATAAAEPGRVLEDDRFGRRSTERDAGLGRSADREGGWWQRPLPAWAQMAAAAAIFAAGVAAGTAGNGPEPQPATVATGPGVSAPGPAAIDPAAAVESTIAAESPLPPVTRDELVRLERRLTAEMNARAGARPAGDPASGQVRAASAAPDPAADAALLVRVQTLLGQSEERQRTENLEMQENLAALTEYIRRFDVQRRVDLRQIEDRLWRIEDATAGQLEQHRNAIDYMVRTSLTGTGR